MMEGTTDEEQTSGLSRDGHTHCIYICVCVYVSISLSLLQYTAYHPDTTPTAPPVESPSHHPIPVR